MIPLFVYGTLREEPVRTKILGRKCNITAARVIGFVRTTIEIGGVQYPAAIKGTGILEGGFILVTPAELELIDRYETSAYKRVSAKTTSGVPVQLYAIGKFL